MEKYERFSNFVDGFILILIIIVSAIAILAILTGLYDYIKDRKKKRSLMKFKNAQTLVALNQDNELLNKHLSSVNRCSDVMDKSIDIYNLTYLNLENLKSRFDRLVTQTAISVNQDNELPDNYISSLNECTSAIDKFIDLYNQTNLSVENIFSHLDRVSSEIIGSAKAIEKSLKIVEFRDKELQKEIAALRFSEMSTDIESYLKCSIEFLDLSSIAKNILHKKLNCSTIEDVFNVMLKYQRRGLLKIKFIGKNAVDKIEKEMVNRGLLSIQDGMYFSNFKKNVSN